MYSTFKYRIKDSNSSLRNSLKEMGFAVNRIWNNANETQQLALASGEKWPSAFDLDKDTSGWCKPLGIHSTTVQEVNKQYGKSRTQFKKPYLRWRSNSKSLTWIPFKNSALSINRETGETRVKDVEFDLFYQRPLEGIIKAGSITADSRGRFYLNLVCELPDFIGPIGNHEVGIDLGLKSVVSLSDGILVKAPKYFRMMQTKLAKAQRAGKKKQTRNLHAKIKNQRLDFNHKLSNTLVNSYDVLYVGDVKSSDIIKTKSKGMAKSVNDVGWFQLKSFLLYKALARGKICQEVSEKYSTQTCSECGTISTASPKGVAGLNIREWTCAKCNVTHDRDTNAAKNILRSGHRSLLRNHLDTKLSEAGNPGL
jgi:IS605 OrfB family transposase